MAVDVGVFITGDKKVSQKFDEMSPQMHDHLLPTVTHWTEVLAGQIRSRAPNKTGKLRSEIASHVNDTPEHIVGVVFVNTDEKQEAEKSQELEFGGRGLAFEVGAHDMMLGHHWSLVLRYPYDVLVAAHQRKLTTPGLSYMRAPLKDDRDQIEADLKAAAERATKVGD